jgi:hypothetical protein
MPGDAQIARPPSPGCEYRATCRPILRKRSGDAQQAGRVGTVRNAATSPGEPVEEVAAGAILDGF